MLPGVRPWEPAVPPPPSDPLPKRPPAGSLGDLKMGMVKGVMEAEHTPVITTQEETKIGAADALFSLGHAPRRPMTIEGHGAKLVAKQKAAGAAADALKNIGYDAAKNA